MLLDDAKNNTRLIYLPCTVVFGCIVVFLLKYKQVTLLENDSMITEQTKHFEMDHPNSLIVLK